MILHCVFCDFKSETTHQDQRAIFDALAAFSANLDGVIGFDHGPNRDFEMKSANFNGGFVIRFKTKADLDHYANHPTHKRLGGHLCELCNEGGDGIIVFDLELDTA